MKKNRIVVYTREETCVVCNDKEVHSGVIVDCYYTCSEKCADKLTVENENKGKSLLTE